MSRVCVLAVLPLAVVVLALSLSCNDDEERLTLSEYNRWCADWGVADLDPDAIDTWGEVADHLAVIRDDVRSVRPPDELDKYHQLMVEMSEVMLEGPRAQPRNEKLDEADWVEVGRNIIANMYILERQADVSEEIQELTPECWEDRTLD